jgi:starch synthase
MVGGIYGTLPIVHDTGGLHDTIHQLEYEERRGNGFLFNAHNAQGFKWAIDRAMEFFFLDPDVKEVQLNRIMIESVLEFNHSRCAEDYINLYEKMLERPFLV